MSVEIRDLFGDLGYAQMLDHGYVRVQTHPDVPTLTIVNYTEKAQYEGVWNVVTRTCRGLIFDSRSGKVLARPFPKFFNYGDDVNTGPLDLAAAATVTDKLDGSLGILYWTPDDGPAIATRGSFASDQAIHATEVLRDRYPGFVPPLGVTLLFEIIYPKNRIVCDYGAIDDLFLLAAIDIDTGDDLPHDVWGWPGPIAARMPHHTLAEAIAAPPRGNKEGLVALLGDGTRIKIKQEDYVRLHRIITGLNARTIWEWLGDGKTIGDLCATIPDDFHEWVEQVGTELHDACDGLLARAKEAHRGIVAHLDTADADWGRRDYAHLANEAAELRPYLFLLLDGNFQQAADLAWKSVKPRADRTLVNHSEAVA